MGISKNQNKNANFGHADCVALTLSARRPSLMYKDGPHTIRVKIFIMGVDPYRVSARGGSNPLPYSAPKGGYPPLLANKIKIYSIFCCHFS